MKLIIDIDDDYYELVKHDVEIYHNDFLPFRLIANGTPLPKGHGNLVDRDAINDRFYNIWKELESYSNKPTYKKLLDRWSMCMDTAPTIIDADEEASDG